MAPLRTCLYAKAGAEPDRLRPLIMAILFFLAGAAWSRDDTDHPGGNVEEKAAIQDLLDQYGRALNALDAAKAASLYGREAQLSAPGFPTATGREEIESTYRAIFSAISLRLQFTPAVIVVTSERYAYATSTSSGPVTVLATRQTTENKYRELWVFKKERQKWKIEQYSFNQP